MLTVLRMYFYCVNIKTFLLIYTENERRYGIHPVCSEYVLLPLANKAAALAYSMAEYSKVGNTSRDRGRKKVETDSTQLLRKQDI